MNLEFPDGRKRLTKLKSQGDDSPPQVGYNDRKFQNVLLKLSIPISVRPDPGPGIANNVKMLDNYALQEHNL